jgi:hypothetical protein
VRAIVWFEVRVSNFRASEKRVGPRIMLRWYTGTWILEILLMKYASHHRGFIPVGLLVLLMLTSSVNVAKASNPQQVWLLAGQSNMIGYGTSIGDLPPELQQPQTNVQAFTNTNTGWIDLAGGLGPTTVTFGPELSFGLDVAAALPDTDVLLVKAPFGLGTLYDDWRSPNTGRGDAGPHYTNFIALQEAAMALKPDAEIAGMVWMQGEADAYDTLAEATAYESNLRLFIDSLRTDLNSPNMRFVIGQINESEQWIYGDIVRQAQVAVAQTTPNCEVVITSDLPLADGMHYTSFGSMELGSRFAQQVAPISILSRNGSFEDPAAAIPPDHNTTPINDWDVNTTTPYPPEGFYNTVGYSRWGGASSIYPTGQAGDWFLSLESDHDYAVYGGVQQDQGTMTENQTYTYRATLYGSELDSTYEIVFYNATDDLVLSSITDIDFPVAHKGYAGQTIVVTMDYTAVASDDGDVLRLLLLPRNLGDGTHSRMGIDMLSVMTFGSEPVLLEGDANRDGVVSAGDYAAVQANFGNTGEAGILGDANGDGVVSAGDYASVQANFGNTGAAEITPEPATMALLGLGGLMIARRRRR